MPRLHKLEGGAEAGMPASASWRLRDTGEIRCTSQYPGVRRNVQQMRIPQETPARCSTGASARRPGAAGRSHRGGDGPWDLGDRATGLVVRVIKVQCRRAGHPSFDLAKHESELSYGYERLVHCLQGCAYQFSPTLSSFSSSLLHSITTSVTSVLAASLMLLMNYH